MNELINKITIGDAKKLTKQIPDESIDLIFTDPVYDRIEDYEWLAKEAKRILKQGKSLLAFCNHVKVISIGSIINKFLDEAPILEHYVAGSIGRLFSHSLQCNLIPCLWFTKGKPMDNKWMFIQQLSTGKGMRHHKWGKASYMISNRMTKLTERNDIIFDPFTGGGTVPAVCKMLGRNYIAFEIDPETAELARERVLNTQPPLFVLEPEQLELQES